MEKKDSKKVRRQYNIEKENEKIIDNEIEVIMKNSPSQKDLIEFIQKIREYRTRIYDLKIQLQGKLLEAYSRKNTINFCPYRAQQNGEDRRIDGYYWRKSNDFFEDGSRCWNWEKIEGESRTGRPVEHYYKGEAEQYNILKATRIFRYYEVEILFWEEMNLLNQMKETDEEEHYFE